MKRVREVFEIDHEIDALLKKRARTVERVKEEIMSVLSDSDSKGLEKPDVFSSLDTETRDCLSSSLPASLEDLREQYKPKRSWKVENTAEYRGPKISQNQSLVERREKKLCLAMRKTKGGYRFVYHKKDDKCVGNSMFCAEHQGDVYKKNLVAQQEVMREANTPESKAWKKLKLE